MECLICSFSICTIQDPGALPRPETCFRASNAPSITSSHTPSLSPTIQSSEGPSSSSIRPSRLRTPGPSTFPSTRGVETVKPTQVTPSLMPTTLEVSMSYSYSYSYSFSYNLHDANYIEYHQTEFGRTTTLEQEEEWC